MERKINKLEHSHVEVVCTVDKENWKKAQDKAFKKLAANVEVKGFRKGKAPENLVRERVNHAEVLSFIFLFAPQNGQYSGILLLFTVMRSPQMAQMNVARITPCPPRQSRRSHQKRYWVLPLS